MENAFSSFPSLLTKPWTLETFDHHSKRPKLTIFTIFSPFATSRKLHFPQTTLHFSLLIFFHTRTHLHFTNLMKFLYFELSSGVESAPACCDFYDIPWTLSLKFQLEDFTRHSSFSISLIFNFSQKAQNFSLLNLLTLLVLNLHCFLWTLKYVGWRRLC